MGGSWRDVPRPQPSSFPRRGGLWRHAVLREEDDALLAQLFSHHGALIRASIHHSLHPALECGFADGSLIGRLSDLHATPCLQNPNSRGMSEKATPASIACDEMVLAMMLKCNHASAHPLGPQQFQFVAYRHCGGNSL